jgi:UDP-N-acetylglucosamine acyltransferase
MKPARIHPSAIVDEGAEIGSDCEIGPYAVVLGGVRMGARNRVHAFAVIGDKPQDKRAGGEATRVEIGDDNVFREHVTVHRGTRDTITRIGSRNLFMVGCHVAHDVTIGSHVILANAVQLAGHSVVEDHATFGGLAGVAQFVRVGESAFVAAGAMVERDVPPFCIVQGDRARVRAVNRVGLERRGVPAESVAEIERVFRAVFSRKRPRAEVLRELETSDPYAARLLAALARA